MRQKYGIKSRLYIFLLLPFLFTLTCQAKRNNKNLRELSDPLEIADYDYPTKAKSGEYTIIPIIHTTDVHGHVFPEDQKNKDGDVTHTVGGATYFSSLVNALEKDWEGQTILYLDSGDVFQGGYESKITKGKIMSDFFKEADVKYTTIGNHEFDYGKDYLFDKFETLKDKFVCANAFKKGEEKKFDNTLSTTIYQYPGTQIKLGIIGIATAQTLTVTSGDVSYVDISSEYKNIIETEAKKLRDDGANAVILLAHLGYTCRNADQLNINKLRLTDSTSTSTCESEGELNTIISQLAEGTIDLALGGHLHINNHFFINGIPAVLTRDSLHYFSIVYLYFKNNVIDKTKTVIEGPVPVCSKVFSNYGRCADFSEDESKNQGDLVDFKFHKTNINENNADGNIKTIIDDNIAIVNETASEVLFTIIGPEDESIQINYGRVKKAESFMGNLAADIYRELTDSDLGLSNHGTFRSTWSAGKINMKNFYDMFVFDNTIMSVKLNGKDLKYIIEHIELQDGDDAKGFYAFSGATITYDKEKKKIVKMIMDKDNEEIKDDKIYKLSATSFLLSDYGDDMTNCKGKVNLMDPITLGDEAEYIKKYLKEKGEIRVLDYYNPEKPRFIEGTYTEENSGKGITKIRFGLVIILLSLFL